jgi:1-acyl-sn-glycerol-3-phosphate acyltransferase
MPGAATAARDDAQNARNQHAPDRRSALATRAFGFYAARYMARHFHALRIARDGLAPRIGSAPAIVYCNHPSWWDPLVLTILATRLFPHRAGYGPIDADALARYPILERVGLFGVGPGAAGARQFLRVAGAVLQRPGGMLWITPEGRFSDPRGRPLVLRPGLAHLARRVPEACFVPLALEYPFWEERTPEALLRFGRPIAPDELHGLAPREVTARLADALERTMTTLRDEAIARDPSRFEVLVGGAKGVGGIYDLGRRAKALLSGKRFAAGHGRTP